MEVLLQFLSYIRGKRIGAVILKQWPVLPFYKFFIVQATKWAQIFWLQQGALSSEPHKPHVLPGQGSYCLAARCGAKLTYKITTYRNGTSTPRRSWHQVRLQKQNLSNLYPTCSFPSFCFSFCIVPDLCSSKEASSLCLFSHLSKFLEDAVVCLNRTVPGDGLSKPDLYAFRFSDKAVLFGLWVLEHVTLIT